ncbi:MAG: hypothetical protein SNJ71_00385 [Bacteroidales bacterium]
MIYDDITHFCDRVAERGVIVVYDGSGRSGSFGGLDNTDAKVTVPGTGSVAGLVPAGMLLVDVVDIDESRFHINFHKDEVRVNSKVLLMKKGWVWTNKVKSGDVPFAGAPAYLAPLGELTTSNTSSPPRVGTFRGRRGANGYVMVEIDIS